MESTSGFDNYSEDNWKQFNNINSLDENSVK